MSLAAKTIFITGASRGIGLELVKQILQLPKAPEHIFAACRNPKSASALQELTATNPNLTVIKLDVEKSEEIESAYQETVSILGDKGLNLLINNAGINKKTLPMNLRTVERHTLIEHFDVNCAGTVMVVQKFLPLLEKAAATNKLSKTLSCNEAAVVNVSSMLGSQESIFNGHSDTTLPYKISKSALDMATVVMHRELSPLGILVMGVHPGWVSTDMGGSGADLVPEQSVAALLKTFASAGEANQGRLTKYDGTLLPF